LETIYPEGDVLQAPSELVAAVQQALVILGVLELPDDEVPDESVYNHPEKFQDWAEHLKQKRKNPDQKPIKYGENGETDSAPSMEDMGNALIPDWVKAARSKQRK
jgi:hypothetical protein